MILALMLAAGSAAALAIGVADTPRARRGVVPPTQPVSLVVLAACFAWLSFATWPHG